MKHTRRKAGKRLLAWAGIGLAIVNYTTAVQLGSEWYKSVMKKSPYVNVSVAPEAELRVLQADKPKTTQRAIDLESVIVQGVRMPAAKGIMQAQINKFPYIHTLDDAVGSGMLASKYFNTRKEQVGSAVKIIQDVAKEVGNETYWNAFARLVYSESGYNHFTIEKGKIVLNKSKNNAFGSGQVLSSTYNKIPGQLNILINNGIVPRDTKFNKKQGISDPVSNIKAAYLHFLWNISHQGSELNGAISYKVGPRFIDDAKKASNSSNPDVYRQWLPLKWMQEYVDSAKEAMNAGVVKDFVTWVIKKEYGHALDEFFKRAKNDYETKNYAGAVAQFEDMKSQVLREYPGDKKYKDAWKAQLDLYTAKCYLKMEKLESARAALSASINSPNKMHGDLVRELYAKIK